MTTGARGAVALIFAALTAACVSSLVEGIANARQMTQPPSNDGPVIQSVTHDYASRLPTSISFGPVRRLNVAGLASWAHEELEVDLTPGDTLIGPDGVMYVRFHQEHRGVPVQGTTLLARVESGQITELNGLAQDDIDVNTTPRISPTEALAVVNEQAPDLRQFGEPELVVFPMDDQETTRFYLSYRLRFVDPTAGVVIAAYVDARAAEILTFEPEFVSYLAEGQGQTTDGRTVTFATQHTSEIPAPAQGPEIVDVQTGYRLFDEERNIHTMSLGGVTEILQLNTQETDSGPVFKWDWPYLPAHELIEDDNVWESTPHAVDAHWGMAQTYDYYQAQHGWRGWDGKNGLLRVYMDYFQGYANAFFSWARFIGFGDGGVFGRPLTTLDVVAHEYTHAVSEVIADFSWKGEAGSIDEAVSDIFATHQKFTRGEGSWMMGEEYADVRLKRNLADPKSMGFPDTYEGDFWEEFKMSPTSKVILPEIHGHNNSLVMSHWFYLVSEGGEGENDNEEEYDIEPIGIDNAANIVFRSLPAMGSHATFKSARDATIRETKRQFGKCSDELREVTNAWNAVGVGPPACGCFEGSFDYHVQTDGRQSQLKFFVRGEDFAVEVPTNDGGTAVMYTTEGDPYRHVQGEPDFPNDPASSAARMLFLGRIPALVKPGTLMKRKEYVAYRNRHRTGQRQEMGDYTIYEYQMDQATLWATEDVCMDMTDWSAILMMRPSGLGESARQQFFGFPVRLGIPGQGLVWIENLREHEVADSYFQS